MAAAVLFKPSMLTPPLSRLASSANAAVFQKFGKPIQVLKVQKMPLKEIAKKEVQIKMIAAPVTSFDINTIYGKNPMGLSFPTIAGSEGVGVVEKVGSGVTGVKPNDTVLFVKPYQGTWCERVVVPEDIVATTPEGVAPELLCSLMNSAGIAYRMLSDFATLKAGDFVLQNDASSPVGMAVIQLCKSRNIKTINIVNDMGEYSEAFRRLESLGGDIIVKETMVHHQDFKKIMCDIPSPKLALNGRGGKTMTDCLRVLKNATVVTYNQSSDSAFDITSSYLVNNNNCLKGFNMNTWLQSATSTEVKKMMNELCDLIRGDELRFFLKKDKFSEVVDAVDSIDTPVEARTPLLMMDQ